MDGIKLATWQKIIIVALVLVIAVAVIYNSVENAEKDNSSTQAKNELTVNELYDKYVDKGGANSENNQAEKSLNNTTNKIEESYNEDEKKAVELAKDAWGDNDSNVTFNITDHEENIYHISVNNNETTEVIAWYEINIENGEVSDY